MDTSDSLRLDSPPVEPFEDAVSGKPAGGDTTIRPCRGMDEFEACVALQQQTWGYPDIEVTPRKAFLLAQELGGQVIGAFTPAGRLIGFAMALAATDTRPRQARDARPEAYLHSHMLAVAPEYRNSGLGRQLKLAQREEALARGIRRMTWTFDPLAAKNAYFNIHKLGAVARRYSPDFYGVSSSRLQGGLPTDRLHAEWWMQSARVAGRVRASEISVNQNDAGAPATLETIVLPHQLEEWKRSERTFDKILAVQSANRALFADAFARGLAVTGFRRDAEGHGVYVLEAWHQPEDAL